MKETKKKPAQVSKVESPKNKAIEIAVAQIEKQFGKGSIMKLGDEKSVDIDVIPTGALSRFSIRCWRCSKR